LDKWHWWIWVCIFSMLASLFLQWNTGIIPIGGGHDSLRYLDMAETLSKGKWLGDYNHMALIRSPVYSGLLGLNRVMGWSLQQMQTIAYLMGILLLAVALRKMDVAGCRVAAVCALCAFHPAAWISCKFVTTEALYTPAVTIVLASAIGVIGSVKEARYPLVFWLLALSVSVALAWRMRDESMWLIPASVVYIGYFLWELMLGGRDRGSEIKGQGAGGGGWRVVTVKQGKVDWRRWGLRLACVVLPCLSSFSLTAWIQQQNLRHYGVAVINELAEPGFKTVFSWLTRLDGEFHHPYIPVTRKAMYDANRVSSHFQMLYPYLSRQFDGGGWSQFGCQWMGVCDELAGGWAVWAIRDAANSIGAHASADQAARFYADLALEIEMGCRTGELSCTSNPTGNMLAPPLKWVDIPRLLSSTGKVLWMTFWLGDLPEVYQLLAEQVPSAELIERYGPVVGVLAGHQSMYIANFERIISWMFRVIQTICPEVYQLIAEQAPSAELTERYGYGPVVGVLAEQQSMHIANFERIISWMFRVIQTICGIWIPAVVVMKGIALIRGKSFIIKDGDYRSLWVISLLTVLIIGRLAIISYVDAMSYLVHVRYMLVIYPALIALICLMLPSWPFPRQQDWKKNPLVSI